MQIKRMIIGNTFTHMELQMLFVTLISFKCINYYFLLFLRDKITKHMLLFFFKKTAIFLTNYLVLKENTVS